jgi:hypothetical protein
MLIAVASETSVFQAIRSEIESSNGIDGSFNVVFGEVVNVDH